MKKRKIVNLDIDDMPVKDFIHYLIEKMSEIPCNATVNLMLDEDLEPALALTYFKNECKK